MGASAHRSLQPTGAQRLPALGTAAAATVAALGTAATTTTAAAATAALFTWTRDVHVEVTTIDHHAVHGLDGLLGFRARAVLDEAEAARLAAVAVDDDARGLDVAVGRESVPEILITRVVREIAYV